MTSLPSAIVVPVTTQKPDALFLRRVIAGTKMPDGRPVEMWTTGASLGIAVGEYGADDRITQTISLSKLGEAWMRAIDDPPLTAEEILEQVRPELDSSVEDAVLAAIAMARGEQR